MILEGISLLLVGRGATKLSEHRVHFLDYCLAFLEVAWQRLVGLNEGVGWNDEMNMPLTRKVYNLTTTLMLFLEKRQFKNKIGLNVNVHPMR